MISIKRYLTWTDLYKMESLEDRTKASIVLDKHNYYRTYEIFERVD